MCMCVITCPVILGRLLVHSRIRVLTDGKLVIKSILVCFVYTRQPHHPHHKHNHRQNGPDTHTQTSSAPIYGLLL